MTFDVSGSVGQIALEYMKNTAEDIVNMMDTATGFTKRFTSIASTINVFANVAAVKYRGGGDYLKNAVVDCDKFFASGQNTNKVMIIFTDLINQFDKETVDALNDLRARYPAILTLAIGK